MNKEEMSDIINKLAYLEAENTIMKQTLKQIVACDYRGNMPTEQSLAKNALDQLASFRAKFFSGEKIA